jgi:hypothetical protein
MERIATLSIGAKLMLGAGLLLFLDLFFTWQNVPQRFGRKFDVTASLDGWDRLGLVVGLLTLVLLVLVFVRETDADLSPDVPWNRITLVLAALVLGVTGLKVLTDADSAWAAYAGLGLAALVLLGAFLDRTRLEPDRDKTVPVTFEPRVRVAAGASNEGQRRTSPEPDLRTAESSRRW